MQSGIYYNFNISYTIRKAERRSMNLNRGYIDESVSTKHFIGMGIN